MDSIFAKIILLFASALTVLTGADYIKISSESLTYNFKTGDQAPIYYLLNTENVGIKKVRFDVTSQSNWVSVYREGDQAATKTSLELAQYAPLNFVLEIHPERLPDGASSAKVTVEAVDLQDYSTLESKEVSILVNKNLKETLSPTPLTAEIPTEMPAEVSREVFKETITPIQAPISTGSSQATPTVSSTPRLKSVQPVKTPFPASSPILTPQPEIPPSVLKQIQSVIDSLKLFLKRFF